MINKKSHSSPANPSRLIAHFFPSPKRTTTSVCPEPVEGSPCPLSLSNGSSGLVEYLASKCMDSRSKPHENDGINHKKQII